MEKFQYKAFLEPIGPIQTIKPLSEAAHRITEDFKQKLTMPAEAQEDHVGVNDPVEAPRHYQGKGMQAIDAMQAFMTPEEFRGYCKGNCQKYLIRAEKKNGIEDYKKAAWYLQKLISVLGKK